ncbi:MAG: glycosyltransferase family 39 protein, partial [Phycisphaerae bacterium]|nr:glycosyltransferase family 39 protein [Phycisphaerae bacterium]
MAQQRKKTSATSSPRKIGGGDLFVDPKARRSPLILWATIIATVIIAAIPFCYGKYLEFNIADPYDSSLNIYTAQSIVDGQKVGRDIFPSARPATLLVNIIGVSVFGFSEIGPKMLQALFQLSAFGLMFFALRKLYGLLPAAVAVVLAAFYLSCPPYAKFGNVKDQFMVACAIMAVSGVMLNALGHSRRWLIFAGAMAVSAWYFKPTGASVIIAIILFYLGQFVTRPKQCRQTLTQVMALIYGSALGLVPHIIF